jgi:hypothetical protein
MMRWFIALSLIFLARHHAVRADDFTSSQCVSGSFAIDLAHSASGASSIEVNDSGTYIFNDYVFTCDGSIENFHFYASSLGSFLVLVFRQIRSEAKIQLVGFNNITVHSIGAQVQTINSENQIDVAVGDTLGLAFPHGQVLSMGAFGTSSGPIKISGGYIIDGIPSNVQTSQNFEKTYPSGRQFGGYSASITAFVQSATQYLRLSGNTPNAGIAEMFREGEWGRICDTWHHKMGWPNIFCKALGFPESKDARTVRPDEIDHTAQLYMKNLRCKASLIKVLFNCDLLPYDKCDSSLQVFVECKKRVRLIYGNNNCSGVPQIWKFGSWHTICDSIHDPAWHSSNSSKSWTTAFCTEIGCQYRSANNSYAYQSVPNYGANLFPKYPNPLCNVDSPATILECPRQSGQACTDDHDFFIQCEEG